MRETNTLCGQSINVGSLDPRIRFGVTADGPVRLIISKDEKNIGAFGGRCEVACVNKQDSENADACHDLYFVKEGKE